MENNKNQRLPNLRELREKAQQYSSLSKQSVNTIPESKSENSKSYENPIISDSESDDEFLSKLKEENKELEKQLSKEFLSPIVSEPNKSIGTKNLIDFNYSIRVLLLSNMLKIQ